MENDGLKDLFAGFRPELGSDARFMDRLLDRMDAIETVRRENAALRRSNRTAMAIAATAGFIAGVIFTLLFPFIKDMAAGLAADMPDGDFLKLLCENYRLICWSVCGCVSVFISFNTYDIASSLLAPRMSHVR